MYKGYNSILVTGATGFIGKYLCKILLENGWRVRGTFLSHKSSDALIPGVEAYATERLGPQTDWSYPLKGIDVVIHLAARVHVMTETASDPMAEFRKANTAGTLCLANQAAKAGVKRFVFLSTIGVNGADSGKTSYMESDVPHPHNFYSVSKHEAELALSKVSIQTGMDFTVIRAPIVYGPGNPGNFLNLLKILQKGIPLPFASISNRRSLIYVGNLVDALALCAVHPAAAGKIYLLSDGEDISTSTLIMRTAEALRVKGRTFPLPADFMRFAGKLIGKSGAINQLLGSLVVDSSKIRNELGWKPPFTMDEGLRMTAAWFRSSNSKIISGK
ncbi:MAG TPA: NAD-dependent epimerase/dehydratase family protein [Desulfosporosinus sp.]|nr:NAD-dependent epimerase/dehydratase family protein [Desulfosporosinus sp.]